jgi:hypothetical protein
MIFLVCFSFIFSFLSSISFAVEHPAEDRTGYYCMQFQPQMSALLAEISKEIRILVEKKIYEGGDSRKRIQVSHYDFKDRYNKINRSIEEKKEILLIAQQNSADLEMRKNSIKDELKSVTELDVENLKAYRTLMWTEYNQQLTANTRQIRDVNFQIKQEKAKAEKMKPYVDDADTFIGNSITHAKLIDFAKQNAPDIFDVSDQSSIDSINRALVHLLGEND